jgi:hypothetical protein
MIRRIRDALSGRFTTKAEADARPAETVAEEIVSRAECQRRLLKASADVLADLDGTGRVSLDHHIELSRAVDAVRGGRS